MLKSNDIMKLFGKKEKVDLEEKTYGVEGMMCSHCEDKMKAKLLEIPGVKEAQASAPLKKICVKVTPDVTDEMISNAVAEAGYKFKA